MTGKHLLERSRDYVRYLLESSSRYRIHSPFLYTFVTEVFNAKELHGLTNPARSLRKRLRRDHTVFEKEELGAGSHTMTGNSRTVAKEVRSAGIPHKYGKLLAHMVNYYGCQNVLELGTSAGMGTAYLAGGQRHLDNPSLVTIEGCRHTHDIAVQNLSWLESAFGGFHHISALHGEFDEVLNPVLENIPVIDLVYLDGNHRKEPLLRYFRKILPNVGKGSIMVVDDIHWSGGMEEAWENICSQPQVTMTIDLYRMGIVLFEAGLSRENHVVWY